MKRFEDLQLIQPLLRAVQAAGYTQPSPIQQKAIPPVLQQRDLLGCAQTGTGKTAAFALPILQLLQNPPQHKGAIRVLVLTPTRELALQIQESFETYGRYLPHKSVVVFGGVGQAPQVAALRRGVEVLVATPGRLLDLIGQGHVKLHNIEIFVLDEADRMLDMGFINDVKKVLRLLPKQKQTLLFSATIPPEIATLAGSLLQDPVKVYVTPSSTTVEAIEQSLYKVDKANKRHLLAQLLAAPGVDSALVFTRTKHGADRVARDLARAGVKAAAIHGDKSQGARQTALARLKSGSIQALVATDIAARGLDIQDLTHVFNYDLPNIPETYVHRIGRTGRAGHDGVAVSFCCFDELEYLRDIEKLIGFSIPEVTGHDWPMQVLEKAPKAQNGRGQNAVPKQAVPKKQNEPKKQAAQKAAKQKAPAPAGQGRTKAAGGKNPGGEQRPATGAPAAKQQNPPRQKPAGKAAPPRQGGRNNPPEPPAGSGHNIVTKTPVWAQSAPAPAGQNEGDTDMGNNRNRRRGGARNKNRNKGEGQPQGKAAEDKKAPGKKTNNGLYDFSEAELAEDTSIKVVSRSNAEVKYASFEDYLKDH